MGLNGKHRSLVGGIGPLVRGTLRLFWVAVCAAAALPSVANASCRQALALGLDVSNSVDAAEYNLQRRGLAQALSSEQVRAILLQTPDAPVWITVFEWSSADHQIVIQPWVAITAASLPEVVDRLITVPRIDAPPTTATGAAMQTGAYMLAQMPDCWRHTLDLSTDGAANVAPRPQDVILQDRNMTINVLVIGAGDPKNLFFGDETLQQLVDYSTAHIIRGDAAFVETATDYADYTNAMKRKLLRELHSLALSQRH